MRFSFEIASKSRCPALSGQAFVQPGQQIALVLKEWMNDGTQVKEGLSVQGNGNITSDVDATDTKAVIPLADNPNRELLKRIGKITRHDSKQIAAILQANFPGLKSDQLGEQEIQAVVDAMCVDAAIKIGGMDFSQAQTIFSEWLHQQNIDADNEELARLWMGQVTF